MLRVDLVAPLLTIILLAGCGGGVGGTGGGDAGGGTGGGGAGGTGVVSQGTISKAEPASLTVNGTAYQITASTTVTVDAQPARVTDLQPGMFVEIGAYKYTESHLSEAKTITYKNTLTGPISSINANCASMIVLGQTVEADNNTLPALINGLCDYNPGQMVEVSGFISDPMANSVLATFIRLKSASQKINVSGAISNVLVEQKIFVVGALTIDYANAKIEPAGATPAIGQFAQVRGIATSPDTLSATEVEITTQGLGGAPGIEAEVSGFISNLSGKTFTINGQAIDSSHAKVSPATTLLANGLKVDVHGKLSVIGVIDATEIEVEPTSPSNIQSTVEATNAAGLTLLGKPILVNNKTILFDKRWTRPTLKLTDIQSNDQIAVSC